MRILHVVETLFKYGGDNVACVDFVNKQAERGYDVALFTTSVPKGDELVVSQKVKLLIKCERVKFKLGRLSYVPDLNKRFESAVADFKPDIVHVHALWDPLVHTAIKYSAKLNIPIIHSPHGMLTSWAMANKKYKKKLAWLLYQYRDLLKVSAFHVTCAEEKEDVLRLGFKQPIHITPLGIDVPKYDYTNRRLNKILFMSRIHPKKGLINLVEAWNRIKDERWSVVVCGPDDDNHLLVVKKRIEELGLSSFFDFRGSVFGSEKEKLLRECSVFVLPTYSEIFGIVILEALAPGMPVISTKGCPWEIINDCKAGWWIDVGVDPLYKALLEFLNTDIKIRTEMSVNAYKIASEKYSWDVVIDDLLNLYNTIINK